MTTLQQIAFNTCMQEMLTTETPRLSAYESFALKAFNTWKETTYLGDNNIQIIGLNTYKVNYSRKFKDLFVIMKKIFSEYEFLSPDIQLQFNDIPAIHDVIQIFGSKYQRLLKVCSQEKPNILLGL